MNAAESLHDTALRERIRAALDRYEPVRFPADDLREAAVSIVLLPAADGTTRLLLTRRTPRMRAHSGQYALPGGKIDPGETPSEAALRELAEEVGLHADRGAILGRLDDLPTRAGFLIHPFVIWLDDMPPIRPAPDEIAAVFLLPLADLFAGRGRGGNRAVAAGDEDEPGVFSLYIPTLGHDLFAPTAAILDHFREIALSGRATPAVRYGEPAFARK